MGLLEGDINISSSPSISSSFHNHQTIQTNLAPDKYSKSQCQDLENPRRAHPAPGIG
jgi:hypothetical protein